MGLSTLVPRRVKTLRRCIAFILAIICFPAFHAAASEDCKISENPDARRLAVVIGNGSYPLDIGALKNPANDARAIARMLSQLNFTVVRIIDGTEETINHCVDEALALVEKPEVALFHYSGHGVQFEDSNFLVAVDAAVSTKPLRGFVALQPIVEKLQRRADATLVFLDACRDNPLSADGNSGLSVATGRGIKPGVVSSDVDQRGSDIPTGTLVAFATSPDTVALDGEGDFSPFSQALLEALPTPGYSIQRVLSEVTRQVGEATEWEQTPWVRSSLNRELKLFGDFDLESAQQVSKNQAAEALALNEKGRRDEAILAALKGLPSDPQFAQAKFFPDAMDALYRVVRSDRTWINPEGSLITLERSSNGNSIVILIQTEDGIMTQVWDAREHRQLLELHTGHVAYTLDNTGTKLAVSSPSDRVTIWDVAKGEEVAQFNASPLPVPGEMSFSPDGNMIVVNEYDQLRVLRLQGSKQDRGETLQLPGSVASFGGPDTLCTAKQTNGELVVGWLNIGEANFKKVGAVSGSYRPYRITCDRESGSIGLVYTENIDDSRASAWLRDGRRVDLELSGLHVIAISASPDQKWLAITDNGGNVNIYSAESGQVTTSPFASPGYQDGYGNVYYGPDGGPTTSPSYLTPPVGVWAGTPTGPELIIMAMQSLSEEQRAELASDRIALNQ